MWHLAMAPRALLLTRCCSHILALLRTQCSPCVCRRSGQPGWCPRMRVCTRQRHTPHHLPHTTYSVRCYVWAQATTPGWALASTIAQGGRHDTSPGCIPSLPPQNRQTTFLPL
ncbi:hypothetical protein T484DRAFT_1989729, partial [Baffinella frigidus]